MWFKVRKTFLHSSLILNHKTVLQKKKFCHNRWLVNFFNLLVFFGTKMSFFFLHLQFRAVVGIYYRGAHAVLLVYDVTNPVSVSVSNALNLGVSHSAFFIFNIIFLSVIWLIILHVCWLASYSMFMYIFNANSGAIERGNFTKIDAFYLINWFLVNFIFQKHQLLYWMQW